MTFGSLFAGIGGFDLGFERAGMVCKWQVEINEFCRRVLAKHWPDVRRHDDVKTFPPTDAEGTDAEGWRVDVICGGFPCQDISVAGLGDGIDGERSGLWSEYARIVRVLRPRLVVVENVPALLARGLHRVLGDLAACGYDAQWDCVPAAAVGAPHVRDRVWLVAYPHGQRQQAGGESRAAADGDLRVRDERTGLLQASPEPSGSEAEFSDTESDRRRTRRPGRTAGAGAGQEDPAEVADADGERREEQHAPALAERAGLGDRFFAERPGHADHWRVEPGMGRVADGVPNRVDRLRGLGNAVVPQVAEWIGRRLMELT